MQSELFEKGLVVRKEVLGAEYVDKSIKGADDFALAMDYASFMDVVNDRALAWPKTERSRSSISSSGPAKAPTSRTRVAVRTART